MWQERKVESEGEEEKKYSQSSTKCSINNWNVIILRTQNPEDQFWKNKKATDKFESFGAVPKSVRIQSKWEWQRRSNLKFKISESVALSLSCAFSAAIKVLNKPFAEIANCHYSLQQELYNSWRLFNNYFVKAFLSFLSFCRFFYENATRFKFSSIFFLLQTHALLLLLLPLLLLLSLLPLIPLLLLS